MAVRENASWMFHEQTEQSVFGGGQFDFTARARDHMCREVDDQIVIFKYGDFFGRPCLALHGTEARQQFWSAKWLGNVIVRTSIQSRYFFLHIIPHRQYDDGYFTPFAQAF